MWCKNKFTFRTDRFNGETISYPCGEIPRSILPLLYEVSSLFAIGMKSSAHRGRRKASDNFAKRQASLRRITLYLHRSSYNFVRKIVEEKCAFLSGLKNTFSFCFAYYNLLQSKQIRVLRNMFLQNYHQITKLKENKNSLFSSRDYYQ